MTVVRRVSLSGSSRNRCHTFRTSCDMAERVMPSSPASARWDRPFTKISNKAQWFLGSIRVSCSRNRRNCSAVIRRCGLIMSRSRYESVHHHRKAGNGPESAKNGAIRMIKGTWPIKSPPSAASVRGVSGSRAAFCPTLRRCLTRTIYGSLKR